MSTLTIVETTETKTGEISIKPFFNPGVRNMGLEKYEMVVFDGIHQVEHVALLDANGMKRYVTGLNEFAPDIKLIPDKEKKAAKVKEIRKIVAQLEREIFTNIVEVDDPEFWNKCIHLKPDNDEFWSKIKLKCGNSPIFLDPKKPMDLVLIYAIEAGGFSMVAPSYEAARSMNKAPKFYLDKYVDTASTKTEVKKIRNKALSTLQTLFDSNQNKLFYIAKIVDGNSTQYKKTTPNDIIYDNMDKFINGEGVEKNLKRAATAFNETAALDMENLKIRSIIKDSTFYKLIAIKSDGFIYHLNSTTMMGRNVSDCVEFLKNPLNDAILIDLTREVEKFWNM